MEPFDILTRGEDVWKRTLDGWCSGERWAVGGLVILCVDNNICGAMGMSDSGNFARRLCV